MTWHWFSNSPWIYPVACLLGGLLAGLLVERFVVRRLLRLAIAREWHWTSVVFAALSNVVVLWGVLIGLDLALDATRPSPRVERILEDAISVLVLLSGTWVVARLAGAGVRSYGSRVHGAVFSASLFSTIAQIFVIAVGALTALSSLGVQIAPLLTALGVGGLAVALALQGTLANLFSGIQLVASRQLRPGDLVRLDPNIEGRIVDITWRTTTLVDQYRNIVVIPNQKLAESVITNASLPHDRIVFALVAVVTWKRSLEELERVALDGAREAVTAVADAECAKATRVRFSALGENTVEITAEVQLRSIDQRNAAKSIYLKRVGDAARSSKVDEESRDHEAEPDERGNAGDVDEISRRHQSGD